jgi:hypothetical protein
MAKRIIFKFKAGGNGAGDVGVLACDTASLGITHRFEGSQGLQLQDQTADEEQTYGKMCVIHSTYDITSRLRKTIFGTLIKTKPFIILHICNDKIKTHFNY